PCFLPGEVTGDVALLGTSVGERRVGELAGTIGMVFQDFEAQLFSTDVTQEVVFGLEHTGVAPADMPARVTHALAATGLAGCDGRVIAQGAPHALLADVETCVAAGVRPLDVCRVFAALGLPAPPLALAAAAARLRDAGLVPLAPAPPAPSLAAGPPLLEVCAVS